MHHYNSISPFMHCKCVQQARGHTRFFYSCKAAGRDSWGLAVTLPFGLLFRVKTPQWEISMHTHAHLFSHIWPVYTQTLHVDTRKGDKAQSWIRRATLRKGRPKAEAKPIVYSVCCLTPRFGLFHPSLLLGKSGDRWSFRTDQEYWWEVTTSCGVLIAHTSLSQYYLASQHLRFTPLLLALLYVSFLGLSTPTLSFWSLFF